MTIWYCVSNDGLPLIPGKIVVPMTEHRQAKDNQGLGFWLRYRTWLTRKAWVYWSSVMCCE